MSRSNTIGIVGIITAPVRLTVDAEKWEQRIYETTLTRTRPSGTRDTYTLQFAGQAAGSEKMLDGITEGVEVLVGGEIRSENRRDPKPEETRVRIYIYAEVIAVNEPPANDQNEAGICGHICMKPHFKMTRRRTSKGKRIPATSIMVAVNTPSYTSYIPCVCFGWNALRANLLEVGDYVEVYGRFQSRNFKKYIKGREIPYLRTTHEVCAVRLQSDSAKHVKSRKGESADHDNSIKQGTDGV